MTPALLPAGSITRGHSATAAALATIANAFDQGSRRAEGILARVPSELPAFRRPLSQEDAGACVGIALANLMNTAPRMQKWSQQDGFLLWMLTKRRDMWPDNELDWEQGTDPEVAYHILRRIGAVKGDIYTNVIMAMKGLMKAAKRAPLALATPWFEGMDHPDPVTGEIHPTGRHRGDHEIVILGKIDAFAVFLNSWPDYEPWKRHGSLAIMHRRGLRRLCANGAMAQPLEKVQGFKEPTKLRQICEKWGVEVVRR